MKRVISLISIFLCVVLVFGACNRGNNRKDTTNTTVLNVGVFQGGLGTEWVYAAAKRFEKLYENHSFEPGKTGVSIKPISSRSMTQTGLELGIEHTLEEVIFAEGANALYFANKGQLLDISDIVEQPLNYDPVTKSTWQGVEEDTILSKLNDRQKRYFSAVDDKFYALPTVEAYYGIAYDIEIFENSQNPLYFGPDGEFVTSLSAPRSSGPDGDPNTLLDNGLPATYEQFFKLLDRMVELNIVPIMWGGTVQEYVNSLLIALAADYEGVEQTELNYNYSGTMKNVVKSIDSLGNPVMGDEIDISANNGYELYKQEGRYHALKFLEKLVSNEMYYNSDSATSGAFSHNDAQGVFIDSKYSNKKKVAMLIDGNWWQSEAKGFFNDHAAEKGKEASMQERKFGFMPLPKVSEEQLGTQTILQLTGHIGFINANIKSYKVDLAKAFLKFCYTEESLREYTTITNICRPVKYEMGDSYNSLSPWGKTMVDVHQTAEMAMQDSASKIMQNYSVSLWYSPNLWMASIGDSTEIYPSNAMIKKGITAKQYFNGLSSYWTKSAWAAQFKNV